MPNIKHASDRPKGLLVKNRRLSIGNVDGREKEQREWTAMSDGTEKRKAKRWRRKEARSCARVNAAQRLYDGPSVTIMQIKEMSVKPSDIA